MEHHEGLPGSEEAAGRLRRLLEERLLVNHFQPIVDLSTRSVYAYEALCRPQDGYFRNPKQLLGVAVDCAEIGVFGRLQRDLAITACTEWPLFLNIEPHEFDEPFLVQPDDPIFRHRRPVYLEITESAPIKFFTQCQSILSELRRKGMLLAIDDLGAGFSNLQYISDLEPDIVKLDRELIRGCRRGSRGFLLLRSMTALCHEMNAKIVAEGIETEEELEAVLEAGADYGQGYLLARPASPPPRAAWPADLAPGMPAPAAGAVDAAREAGPAKDGASEPESPLFLEVRELRAELAESEYRRESLAGRLTLMSHRLRDFEGKAAVQMPDATESAPATASEPPSESVAAAAPAGKATLLRVAAGAFAAALVLGTVVGWLLGRVSRSDASVSQVPPQESAAPIAEPQAGESAAPAAGSPTEAPARQEERSTSQASIAAAAIVQLLGDWAAAWSAQEPDRYLALYSSRFETPAGLSLAEWKQQRRARILRPSFISVTISGLEMSFPEPRLARARFLQFFESPSYSDRVTKTLDLVSEDGLWRVVREVSEPAPETGT